MLIHGHAWVFLILLIAAIHTAIIPGHVARPAKGVLMAERAPSIREQNAKPSGPQITPAPHVPGTSTNFELKRDADVLCSGYSVVGNTYPSM